MPSVDDLHLARAQIERRQLRRDEAGLTELRLDGFVDGEQRCHHIDSGAAGVAIAANRHVGHLARLDPMAHGVENGKRRDPSSDAVVESVTSDAVRWLNEASDDHIRRRERERRQQSPTHLGSE